MIYVTRTYKTHFDFIAPLAYRYFNKEGELIDYKPLLRGTTWNCGGGLTVSREFSLLLLVHLVT